MQQSHVSEHTALVKSSVSFVPKDNSSSLQFCTQTYIHRSAWNSSRGEKQSSVNVVLHIYSQESILIDLLFTVCLLIDYWSQCCFRFFPWCFMNKELRTWKSLIKREQKWMRTNHRCKCRSASAGPSWSDDHSSRGVNDAHHWEVCPASITKPWLLIVLYLGADITQTLSAWSLPERQINHPSTVFPNLVVFKQTAQPFNTGNSNLVMQPSSSVTKYYIIRILV